MTTADLSVTVSTTTRQPAADRPGRLDPATEAQLDHEATAHVEANRPERTCTGYAADWNAWLRFCAEEDLRRPPAAPAPAWRSCNGAGTCPPGPRSPASSRAS
ncbi:hypothetical protein [Streptomyces sp. NPDC054834]